MKKLISLLLIIACLGMCSCTAEDDDSAGFKLEVMNTFSYHELLRESKNEGFIAYWDFTALVDFELEEQYPEIYSRDRSVPMTDEQIEHYYGCCYHASGGKMTYRNDSSDYLVFNDYMSAVGGSGQGLTVYVYFEEEFELPSEYEDWEEYAEEVYFEPDYKLHMDNMEETDDGALLIYRTKENSYGNGEKSAEYYEVTVVTVNSDETSLIRVVYQIPVEDNEEEITELKNLGIPVVTDYID